MSGLRNAFTSNFTSKVLALLLAVLVWYFVDLDVSSIEERPHVRIVLEFAQKDASVVRITDPQGRPCDSVSVELRGPRGDMREVPPDLVCRHVVPADALPDLTSASQRPMPIHLDVADLRLPPRVFAKITPQEITATIDRLREENVPVDTTDCLKGTREDCQYETIAPRVWIRAPAALLEEYRKGVQILPIDVTGLTETQQIEARFPESVRKWGLDRVTVTVHIKPRPEEYEVPVPVPVEPFYPAPESPYKFELRRPKEVKVKVRGPKDLIAKFRASATVPLRVYVDFAGYAVRPDDLQITPKMGYLFKDPQFAGLQILGVPEQAEDATVVKKQ